MSVISKKVSQEIQILIFSILIRVKRMPVQLADDGTINYHSPCSALLLRACMI